MFNLHINFQDSLQKELFIPLFTDHIFNLRSHNNVLLVFIIFVRVHRLVGISDLQESRYCKFGNLRENFIFVNSIKKLKPSQKFPNLY